MVSVRGVPGVNRLDFFGRVGRKALRPGVYVLSLTRASQRPVLRPLLVQVFSPRRTVLLGDARVPRCDGVAGVAARRGLAALTPEPPLHSTPIAPPSGLGSSAAPSPNPAAKPKTSTGPSPDRDHDVLGVDVDIPAPPQLEGSTPWELAGPLLLIGLPLLLMVALVVRFARGTWNP